MKKLLVLLALSGAAFAQTYTYPTLQNKNTWAQEQTIPGGITDVIGKFSPSCDVRAFGATGNDSSHDDSAAITAGIAAGCVNFIFPPQKNATASAPTTYYFGTTINAAIRVDCVNRDLVLVRDKSTLGASQLFHPQGNSGTHLSFFEITNCGLQNGTATTSFTAGKDVYRTDYVDNIRIFHNKFVSCQGVYCGVEKWGSHIFIQDNIYQTWTMHAHNNLVETNDIHFTHNLGVNNPTCTSGCGGNTYFDANGGESNGEGTYFMVGKWIEDNTVLSNTLWECYDSHGGDTIIWRNNKGSNCKFGIQMGSDPAKLASGTLCQNIVIDGNVFTQGSGASGGPGIVVNGNDLTSSGVCQHVKITNNVITGFGDSLASTLMGGYTLYNTSDVAMTNNTAKNTKQTCISFYYNNVEPKVNNFRCEDMDVANSGNSGQVAVIRFRALGSWGVTLDNITLSASSTAFNPAWFLRSDSLNNSFQLGRYTLAATLTTAVFSGFNGSVNFSSVPTVGYFKPGDCAYDTNNFCRWIAASPVQGYSSPQSGLTILTADCTNGNAFFDVNTATFTDARGLAPGALIVIAGAGPAAANLSTQVVSNPGTQTVGGAGVGTRVQIKDACSTSVTAAVVTYQATVFGPSPTVAQDCGTTATCSATPSQGTQVVYGSVALTSASPSTATVTGISPAFTSSSSYKCALNGETNTTSIYKLTRVSGSSFTITGPNTVTDVVDYICAGK